MPFVKANPTLLTHVALGELRHAVSRMTMVECIEQRKTTLSGVVQGVVEATIHPAGQDNDWGIAVEVAQLAQVFIVDAELRQQLEAQVRNEIKLKSDQSDIQTAEEAELTQMASEGRVAEQKLASDRAEIRRAEELHQAEMSAAQAKINGETPVRLLRVNREAEVLREELRLQQLKNRVRAFQAEHGILAQAVRRADPDRD
jgi:hypothetical protein